MKRLKLFFSKTIILVLSVLFQISVLIVMLLEFREYLTVFYIICYIISVAAVLWIVNNRMNPGFKIAWLVLILTFPFFGIIIYLLFGGKNNKKKMQKKLDAVFLEIQNNFKDNYEGIPELLRKENNYAYRQSNYIRKASLCPVYQNSACSYYSPGETVFPVIMEELKKAKDFIFLEFFIIEEGVFWNSILEILKEKAASGVEVRLIYDDVGSLFTLPRHFDKKIAVWKIKCRVFNPFIPIISSSLNNRDHRKILLIDGKTAFTGGMNLADEYINGKEKCGYWKDSLLKLEGDAVWSFTVMFLSAWNYLGNSREDATPYQKPALFSHKKPSGFIQPYADTPLDCECVSETVYMNLINAATDYIYITTPYLIIDNEMLTALCNSAKSGIDVKIITPRIPDKKLIHMMTRSFYPLLLECGVQIYEYVPGFMHSKSFVSDDIYGIVGTVNLDYRSLYLHFECGVWMYKAECIQDIKEDFLEALARSELIPYEKSKEKGWFIRLASAIMRIFAPFL
jgi:cardiolipin synthase